MKRPINLKTIPVSMLPEIHGCQWHYSGSWRKSLQELYEEGFIIVRLDKNMAAAEVYCIRPLESLLNPSNPVSEQEKPPASLSDV